jgi:hypothetical protein
VTLVPATGQYQMYLDGSDVGLSSTNLDAFYLMANGHILFSTSGNVSLSGIGTVAAQDIVEFTPTSLGSVTAGTFAWYFDGSDVALSASAENIDAVSVLPDGRVLVSTTDRYTVTGLATGEDEDLIAFTPTTLGSSTSGTWSMYFDGSDVSLANSSDEDVDAAFVASNGAIHLSTLGSFSVPGVSGANEDVVAFTPTSLGTTTAGTYGPGLVLDGSLYGLASFNVDGFQLR